LLLERLGPRLTSVFRLVPASARVVADLGCDHALLPLALARDDHAHRPALERVIGVDKAAAPLEEARRNLRRSLPPAPLARDDAAVVNGRAVELRLGDGLWALSKGDGVDAVCAAGMGTRNIVEILSPALSSSSDHVAAVLGGVQHLILQVTCAGSIIIARQSTSN
jgi:tRNA A22 N-methylase